MTATDITEKVVGATVNGFEYVEGDDHGYLSFTNGYAIEVKVERKRK